MLAYGLRSLLRSRTSSLTSVPITLQLKLLLKQQRYCAAGSTSTNKPNINSKLVTERLSESGKHIIRVELTDQVCDEYLAICVREFHSEYINKYMYPDEDKRRRFLKLYYDYLAESILRSGLGRLILFKVASISRPINIKTAGGAMIVFDRDHNVKESEEMKHISEDGWQKYLKKQKWSRMNYRRKFNRVVSNFDVPVWFGSSIVIRNEYRGQIQPMKCMGDGIEALMNDKRLTGGKNPIFLGATFHAKILAEFKKYNYQVFQTIKCKDQSGPELQLFPVVLKNIDEATLKQVQTIWHEA